MSKMTLRKRLICSVGLFELILVLTMIAGYSTCKKIVSYEDPQAYLKGYAVYTVVVILVALVLFTISAFYVVGSVRKSVEKLTAAANKMAEGDTNAKLDNMGNDEFGIIAESFNQIVENNINDERVIEAVASGDLTVDINPKSSRDVLGNSLKQLVETNRNALCMIEDAAGTVMTSASEVASASEALAQGSTEQASAIQQITASIDDVAGRTKTNAKEADNAASLMREARSSMEKGNESMTQMVSAMADINTASESISKIIKVIDDIAFQTNILALNAAVEAARAGDAGMGFAVVAEEVRNLAAKSSQAASETAELIEDSIAKIKSGSEIAGETATALEEVSRIILQSEEIVSGIAESSNYQATAIEQIDQAVGQVSMVVQTNSATSEECAAASVELSSQASNMKSLLSVYKLGTDRNYSTASYTEKAKSSKKNEQIISLGGDFGKY